MNIEVSIPGNCIFCISHVTPSSCERWYTNAPSKPLKVAPPKFDDVVTAIMCIVSLFNPPTADLLKIILPDEAGFSNHEPLPIVGLKALLIYPKLELWVIEASFPDPIAIIDGHPPLDASNLSVGWAPQEVPSKKL